MRIAFFSLILMLFLRIACQFFLNDSCISPNANLHLHFNVADDSSSGRQTIDFVSFGLIVRAQAHAQHFHELISIIHLFDSGWPV